jgi:hypothetical protein
VETDERTLPFRIIPLQMINNQQSREGDQLKPVIPKMSIRALTYFLQTHH